MADETTAPAPATEKPAKAPKKAPAKKAPVKAAAPVKAPVKAKAPAPKTSGPSKDIKRAATLLKNVSDPTRLQVILMLADGTKNVGDMCRALSNSQPAVSHHLALLRHGNIIEPTRQGKNNFYSLTDQGAALVKVVKVLMP
jgi:DNA-binding transcriptional ArsR family regulator